MFENSKGLVFLLLSILEISLYVRFLIWKILIRGIIDKKDQMCGMRACSVFFNALENVRLHIQFNKTFIIIY